jgi:hypothetical protein
MADAAPAYTFDDGNPENPAADTSSPGYSFDDGLPENTPQQTAGRWAGIVGHGLTKGVGELADLPGHLIEGADAASKYVADKARGLVGLQPSSPSASFGSPATGAATRFAENTAGLPAPVTPGERVVDSAAAALPSAVFTPEAPVAGLVSAGLSGAASQEAANAGYGPGVQLAAGLAGGLAPAGAGAAARLAARGPSAANMAARVAAADAAGTSLTVGQATGNPVLQKMERVSQMGWGSGPLHAAGETQAENLGTAVDDITSKLTGGTGADISKAGAGENVQTGLTQAKKGMKAAEGAAYDHVDSLVPPTTAVDVTGTRKVLDSLATPTPGAEATTADLIPASISKMRDNMATDAANGTMPYSAVTALRTDIGRRLNPLAQDQVEQGALKQIYKALTSDRDAGAAAVSPEAAQAVKSASALYQQNSVVRDGINKVLGKQGIKTPEQIYQAATGSMNNGPTVIGRVMTNLNPDQQNLLRAAVIKRMASAIPSKGGEEVFDPATFLTRWSGMNADAKNALFGGSGPPAQWRQGLDSFVSTLKTLKNSKTLPNPSGTADAAGHLALMLELLGRAAHGIGGVGTAGLTVLGNYGFARAMTSPKVVRWLATTSKMPAAARATAITQLGRMNDPDARALHDTLQNPQSLEIQHQPDPQAAYDSLPKGTPYTHNGRQIYKGYRQQSDIESKARSAWGAYEPDKYEYRNSGGKLQRRAR